MISDELQKMGNMYRLGVRAKSIARAFDCSESYVNQLIVENRDIFRYKCEHYDDETKAMVVSAVLDGHVTQREAARRTGIHVNTVHNWVVKERRRRVKAGVVGET